MVSWQYTLSKLYELIHVVSSQTWLHVYKNAMYSASARGQLLTATRARGHINKGALEATLLVRRGVHKMGSRPM